MEQGPREGRGWGWGWGVAAWGACRGSLGPIEGPVHILHLQQELGGKIQGGRLGEVSVPGLGRRPPASGLHLGLQWGGAGREAPTAFPGQAVFRTHRSVPGGQVSTFCLSVALQPLASLSRRPRPVHLQLLTPSGGLSSLRPQDDTMGFSSELCNPQGHGAVQQMQEAELRLLEGMRKWMAQRVKSDREYAGLLHHMSLQDSGGQSRGIGPHSLISQVGF